MNELSEGEGCGPAWCITKSVTTMYSTGNTASPNFYPSAPESLVFSVPPPPAAVTPHVSCTCNTCGHTALHQSQPQPSSISTGCQSEEDRTLALQLRAAAIFNKTDVTLPPHTFSLPPPQPAATFPYPPPSHLSSLTLSVPTHYCTCSSSPASNCSSSSSPLPSCPYHCSFTTSAPLSPFLPTLASTTTTTPTTTAYPDAPSPTGMKRMMEMEGETPLKRPRPAGDTEVRMLIQSKAAGSVIGKGGQNISRLRSENPASITVPDCPGPERVLTIGGSEDVVLKVLNEVLQCLDEALQKGNESDARILVHQSQAGCIIGKGGSKIKELREECGGQIKVYTNCCPQSTDRVIQITGDRDRAVLTITRIIELIKDSPIKGMNNPYNPHNFDEFFANEYGGWGESPKGRFPGGPPMGPGGPMGRGPMGRGPMGPGGPGGPPGGGPPGPPPFGRRGPMGPPHGPPPPMRGPPNGDYDGMLGKGKPFMNGSDPHNGDLPTTSTQVTIPKDAAGAIIGKGGARIRKIRSDSGASISIEDSRPGTNDRIITINGSEPQIKHAQYLLQQSVLEYGGQHYQSGDYDHEQSSGGGGGGGGGRDFGGQSGRRY